MAHIDNALLLDHPDLLDQLLATTTDHIDIYDRAGRYLYASPAGATVFGVPATDLVRTPLNAILGMSEGLQEHIFGTVNRQVLVNLLSNAVKFTPTGGKITLEISRTSRPASAEVTRH